MAEKATKTSLKDLSAVDLIAYDNMAKSVCQKYENIVRNYNGIIVENSKEYATFEKYNKIHNAILTEMENRLNALS